MKSFPLLFIAMTLITSNCACAQTSLSEGMPFLQARKLLLKDGWIPIDLQSKSQASEVGTQELMLNEKGIHEVDICSMDAGALCNLFYKKRQACLRVTTHGENLINMRVIDWKKDSSCPGIS